MSFDELSALATPPPPASQSNDPAVRAAVLAAEDARYELTLADSLVHATPERVQSSAYLGMAPATLRALAHHAGYGRWEAKLDEATLIRLMVYTDMRLVDAGKPPFATHDVERIAPPYPRVRLSSRVHGLPRSDSGQWSVVKTHSKVALMGQGIFSLKAGTVVGVKDYGEDAIRSFVEQGVQFAPYPPVERRTCDACDTNWQVKHEGMPCPLCYLENGGQPPPVSPYRDDLVARVEALTAWAVQAGARLPDGDGLWNGEPAPDPLEVKIAEPHQPPATRPPGQLAVTTDGEVSDLEGGEIVAPPTDPLAALATEAPKGTGKARGRKPEAS